MNIKKIVVGELETNCYILTVGDEAIVIDPGDEIEKILDGLGDKKVVGIIVTHSHFDHIGALDELKKITNAKGYDITNLEVGKNKISEFEFEMWKTPGHKEDSIVLYFEKENILFSGDFIFKSTIGRWDLKGGNFLEMQKSIKMILTKNLDMVIKPGHGEETTLRAEKDNLQYFLSCNFI